MAGKYVVVTGCDSGFGFDLIHKLPSTLIPIACCHRKASLANLPKGCIGTVLDITDDNSVEKLKAFVEIVLRDNNGVLVGLVNNAGGLVTGGPTEWESIHMDIKQMDLNFFGTLRVTKALLPMIRISKGRIINVSSIMGVIAAPLGASYAASKFAIEGWSDALRREMIPFGVSVHLIQPGMVGNTQFYKNYTSCVDDAWSRASGDSHADYGKEYKSYCKLRLRTLQSKFASNSTNQVTDAMIHALTALWPKHRYRIGFDAAVLGRVLEWLPTSISDLALTVTDVLVVGNSKLWPQMPATGLSGVISASLTTLTRYRQGWVIYSVLFLIVIMVSLACNFTFS